MEKIISNTKFRKESNLISQETHTQLRRLRNLEGRSRRNTAKELNIHPNTVKSNEDKINPKYTRIKPYKSPIQDKYIDIVKGILESDKTAPRKQRHTAKKIYERLKTKHNFEGSDRTVRAMVQKLKQKPSPKFIPLEFDAGQDAQVDFSDVIVTINGQKKKAHIFSMVLSYSGVCFAKIYERENTEAFLDGHVEAFKYFSGIPKRISYDNLTIAVIKVLEGKNRLLTDSINNLTNHYLFETNFCTPAKGNEKGIVEHHFRFIKHNWFVPVPEFNSWEDLNIYLLNKCEEDKSRTKAGSQRSIDEKYSQESEELISLPKVPYEACVVKACIVDNYSTICFKTNHYSIPVDFPERKVTVFSYYNKIVISDGTKIIATHERSYEKDNCIFDYKHYIKELIKKPNSIPYAKPLRHANLPEEFWTYYHKLGQRYSSSKAGKFFIELLIAYNKDNKILGIIQYALKNQIINIEYILDKIKNKRKLKNTII